ncbi:MAG: glycosyltransferase [Rhodanobacter sp.]
MLTADGQNIAVSVNLANEGKTVLSSAGNPPVNLGAHSVDANGEVIINDLSRAHFPAIAPGASAAVTILLPVAGTLGHSAQILPLQESVAWFNQWGTKPVTVGPFNSCSNDADGKVCNADGKPLATVPAQ